MLIAQGEDPKYLSLQAGHSSIQIAMDCYGHLSPEVKRPAATRMEATLAGFRAPATAEEVDA
jgi:integrase